MPPWPPPSIRLAAVLEEAKAEIARLLRRAERAGFLAACVLARAFNTLV